MENSAAELYKGTGITEFSDTLIRHKQAYSRRDSLSSRADDILVAVAVLGLVAAVSDGEADYCEIKEFTRAFQQEFLLTEKEAGRIIEVALEQIRTSSSENIIDCPCETLNEFLSLSQKMRLFDGLVEVLVADGIVQSTEEHFLDCVAIKLNLVEALKEKFPVNVEKVVKESVVRWS